MNKKNKTFDQKLEESKRFTLKSVANKKQQNMIEEEFKNRRQALGSFENKVLLGENSDVPSITEHKSETIEFKKINSVSNIEIYKQENLERKEMIKRRQEESKIKSIINNKHVYESQNFYNNTNLENIPYEKDSNIARSLRHKKIYKNK